MAVLVATAIGVLAVAFIAYPFFKRGSGRPPAEPAENGRLQELRSRRDVIYSAMEALELDFKSGTMAEEDYRDLEASYRRQALSLLRDIDALEKATGVEDEIERQVRQVRQAPALLCPRCGARYLLGDRFCSRCGAGLPQRRRPS